MSDNCGLLVGPSDQEHGINPFGALVCEFTLIPSVLSKRKLGLEK